MNAFNEARIRLRDGRALGYAEFGDPRGRPLIYCHGFPASRLEGCLLAEGAARSGVRLIALDRPGYGMSDFHPSRRLPDWPDDVTELADALGIGEFPVLGISGGGPYALACASGLGARLSAVGVVCGLGPVYQPEALQAMEWPGRIGFRLAQRSPVLLKLIYGGVVARLMRWFPRTGQTLLAIGAPISDRMVLTRPDVRRSLRASLQEGLRNGPRGPMRDMLLYAHPWGFEPGEIRRRIELWHGECDATVPVSHGRLLAAALPDVNARFPEREGHFSLPILHAAEILATLVQSRASRRTRRPAGAPPSPAAHP